MNRKSVGNITLCINRSNIVVRGWKRCSAVLGRQCGLGGSPHEQLPWFPRGLQRCSAVLGVS
ncbi:hypothetical protein, partial [Moorena sp. SIO2C4]